MRLKKIYAIKKEKKTWVNIANPQNLWPELWDHDNPVESKSNNNYEFQFPINSMLKDEVEKKKLKKKTTKIT
jgi:hypothetical protein